MSGVDTRDVHRDSLFLMADLRVAGDDGEHRVKVRNLSASGMMAAEGPAVSRGGNISVNLRNVGWVEGVVAWVQEDRFGIAFAQEIDPKIVRAPAETNSFESPRYTKPSGILPPDAMLDKSKLRKV